MKIIVVLLFKQLPVSPFGRTLFVEVESHCSQFSEIYIFMEAIEAIWHHMQTLHFFITAVCHAECMSYTFNIAGIHDIVFLDTQLSSNCYLYVCCPLALKILNVNVNMLKIMFCEVL